MVWYGDLCLLTSPLGRFSSNLIRAHTFIDGRTIIKLQSGRPPSHIRNSGKEKCRIEACLRCRTASMTKQKKKKPPQTNLRAYIHTYILHAGDTCLATSPKKIALPACCEQTTALGQFLEHEAIGMAAIATPSPSAPSLVECQGTSTHTVPAACVIPAESPGPPPLSKAQSQPDHTTNPWHLQIVPVQPES
jgi:hypothetical protein